MKSPTSHPFWQGVAKDRVGVFTAFAMAFFARHCFRAGQGQPSPNARSRLCYPSPSLRSGPSLAGPILVSGRGFADCARGARYCFQIPAVAVESTAITTTSRGSTPCGSRLSSFLFFPRPLPAACRTPRRAASPVRPLARWSPMPWMRTSSPAPLWAVLPGQRPAASKSACRPATRATEPLIILVRSARAEPLTRTIRAGRPDGPFAFPKGGADV